MIRFGVDFGGTKIEAAALAPDGRFLARERVSTPERYDDRLAAVAEVLARAEQAAGAQADRVGVGGPGSASPRTGLIRNSNSTVLNGRAFPADLQRVLGRPVRYANDADCLALSEAADGAGAGFRVVFAVIVGTGCGSGICVDGRLLSGRNGMAGEWGHTPLPWPWPDELPAPACWCGRSGCLELWLSGTGFARAAGQSAEAAVQAARAGDAAAQAALGRYLDRFARGLAVVADILDPDIIVLGGGMSNIGELYGALPAAIAPHVFSDVFETPVVPAAHGDSSGVRGAAWLWPPEAP